MNKFKRQNAITIVALVITIILLLILAGISIQAMTNTGLFEGAYKAKREAKRAQITEWLSMKLIEEQAKNPLGTAEQIIEATRQNINNNIAELKAIGKDVTVEETSTEEDGEQVDIYFYVIVDKDVYKVELKGVKFIGELGKFPPVIKLKSLTKTTNSITVQVVTKRNEGGELKYYIKGEDDTEYKLKATKNDTETTHTFEELEQNKTYSIKIVAIAENEQTAEVTKDIELGSVPNLAVGDIIFTYTVDGVEIDEDTWTNKAVNVTANTDEQGFTLQTSKDAQTWNSVKNQIFTENGQMHVRLWDGTNAGGAATANVTNIDTLEPKEFTPETSSTTKSITVTASTTDAEATDTSGKSGIAGYRFKLDEGSWTNYQESGTYTWDDLTQTTDHTITVEAKDNAGNTTTGTATKGTGTIEQPTTATCSPTTWTSGSVTVTLPTKSGYTTRYTTNGTTPTISSTAYSGPFTVSSNCTITFVYSDGTNVSPTTQTANVRNIDTTVPTISTALSSTSKGSNSVTLSVGITDANSGLGKVEWYYGTTSNPTTKAGITSVTDLNGSTTGPTTAQTKTYTVSGLSAGTTYWFKVIAYDVAGKTATSSVISVTTDSPTLASQVAVGDYVAYNATNNYSYTSPKGSDGSHGNGYGSQTFTSSSSIKWRVLSKNTSTGEVVLISEAPIQTDANVNFYMSAVPGFGYAEQELGNICAIYGHGTGANTSKTFSYATGGGYCGPNTSGTITGSGARSINVRDINEITGYEPGEIKWTTEPYSYLGSNYLTSTTEPYKMLFRNLSNSEYVSYWLDGRSIWGNGGTQTYHSLRIIGENKVGSVLLYDYYSGSFGSGGTPSTKDLGIRPVVYLKSTIQTSGKNASGQWTIIDK